MQIYDITGDVKGKNILLLQGPMGNFFNRLDKKFSLKGAKTFRVGLNTADAFFSNRKHYTPYKAEPKKWSGFIEQYFKTNKIDMLFVIGDCRFYQSVAIEAAQKSGVEVFVFEEGYIRPDFITIEKNGVNGYSQLPRNREFYDVLEYDSDSQCHKKNAKKIGSTYGRMALQATIYYLIADLGRIFYPYYKHHRGLSTLLEAYYGVRNFFSKYTYKITERKKLKKILSLKSGYYFVPLQTSGDFQIITHSPYETIEQFIEEVLVSFASHAPGQASIVIKHHPMDRGKKNYSNYILKLAKRLGCDERVVVCHDLHLPTLLKNATGTITVNSTVGISSLNHKTPTFCTGDSFYDIEGLTSKGITLDRFWREPKSVDAALFDKFRCYLIEKTQINGSFYKDVN